MNPIRLGAFELTSRLKTGGMGDIFEGVHLGQGVKVAVKVITRAHAREARYLSAFRHEVQAMARLDHPGIAMVFDVGEITGQAQDASEGVLIAGSPYLVMEYASYGSLSQVTLPLPWADVKTLMLFLLDTLAHAHARGVIHRDLKPGNILFSGPQDWRPGPKLADFGIAHALGTQSVGILAKTSLGSPPYMAPEQWRDEWREYGPWTDLYGLGCLGYHMAAGVPPFLGMDPVQMARGHINDPPPRLAPDARFPQGFEGWLFRLLHKDPRQRFTRAADAARALMLLPDLADGEPEIPIETVRVGTADLDGPGQDAREMLDYAQRQLDAVPTLSLEWEKTAEMDVPYLGPSSDVTGLPLCPIPEPIIPETWERPADREQPMALVGTGLGLYGLRPVPLVDRSTELDLLWQMFRECQEQGRVFLALLTGAAGYGKSRIVQWLCERAHEVGAATVLRAVHSPIAGPGSGLARMMANHLGTVGLPRSAALDRARSWLESRGCHDEYEWYALTEFVAPAAEGEATRGQTAVRFGQTVERFALCKRMLERLVLERPVIVWLDDVHWGSESLGFAEYLLKEPEANPLPVLMLLTARDEALALRPVEESLVKRLLRRRHTRHVVIGPLPPQHRLELVSKLLLLEGPLVKQVDERTAGNPLFAVQLIGDWVRRGILEVGTRGFTLKAGEEASLPDNIHMMWAARVEYVLDEAVRSAPSGVVIVRSTDGDPVAARRRLEIQLALELAAVLGRQVDLEEEWEGACKASSIPCPLGLLDILSSQKLAYRGQSSWTFEHGLMAESVQRLARDSGRWPAHNRACAAMLQALYPRRTRAISERLGLHLFEASDLDSAEEHLIQGVFQRVRLKEYRQALRLLELREQALKKLNVGANDLRLAKGWLLRARILNDRTDFEASLRWSQRAADVARVVGAEIVLAEANHVEAQTRRLQGNLEQALQLYERALDLYRKFEAHFLLARCLLHYGFALLPAGQLEKAWICFEQAQTVAAKVSDEETWVDCLKGLAQASLERGDVRRALTFIEQALSYYSREGNHHGMAACFNNLGECQRIQGDLDGAEVNYRKSLEILGSLGVPINSIAIWLNLALILIEKRQFNQARQAIETTARIMREGNLKVRLGAIHTLSLAAFAGERNWGEWDRHYRYLMPHLVRPGMAERDNAWALERAGDLALEGGEPGRARLAYDIAMKLWGMLGAKDRQAAIVKALERCR